MNKIHLLSAPLRAVVTTLLLALAGFWAAPGARAAKNNPPERMTYQGFLADGGGNPLGNTNTGPQNYDVVFKIYNAESGGGAPLWREQQTVTVDRATTSTGWWAARFCPRWTQTRTTKASRKWTAPPCRN